MSKAAVVRWLESNVGKTVHTKQYHPNGRVWEPGPRLLTKSGKTKFMLNQSYVADPATWANVEVGPSFVEYDWLDQDGAVIHRTVYYVKVD